MLEFEKDQQQIDPTVELINSVVIPPCKILKGAKIVNSIVGPHVSIGQDTTLIDCIVKNSIIQNDTHLSGVNFENSMVGNKVNMQQTAQDLSVGDFNEIKN